MSMQLLRWILLLFSDVSFTLGPLKIWCSKEYQISYRISAKPTIKRGSKISFQNPTYSFRYIDKMLPYSMIFL